MKRIISLILAFSVFMSFSVLLTGCGDDNKAAVKKPTSSDNAQSSEDKTQSENSEPSDIKDIDTDKRIKNEIDTSRGSKYTNVPKIKLFTDGEANFIVVRSEKANADIISTARYFCKAVDDTHSISVEHKNDSVTNNKNRLEINIGVTNRPKAKKLTEEIEKAHGNYGMDYAIVFDNNIIYITGGTDIAIKNGVKAFLSYFCADTNGAVPNNFDYRYHIKNSTAFAINGKTDLSAYKIVVPKFNLSYVIGREVNTLRDEILLNNGSITPRTPDKQGESQYEIVIGNTNRKNTPMPSNTDEYIIKSQGDKIFIVGGSDGATAMAVKQFIKWVKQKMNLPASIDYLGSYAADASEATDEDYLLTWNDEFDTTIDKSVWSVQNGLYSTTTNDNIAPRQKKFSNSADNVYIKDGKLVMKGSYDDNYYYGIEMRTPNSLWLKYGIIEISCKMNFSKGICPAFWLLGNQNNEIVGEFDLFEGLGEKCFKNNSIKCTTITHAKDASKYKSGTMYLGAINNVEESFYSLGNDTWDDEYHTIGCEWTPTSFKYVIDGDVFIDIDTTQGEQAWYTYNGMMQIVLTHYTGNDVCTPFTGLPDSTTDWKNNNFTIDNIRLYQNSDGVLQN